MNKKSFLVYCDIQNIVESMTDSEAGLFFKAMLDYGNMEEVRKLPENLVFLFMSIKNQMDRDLEKYSDICERNRINGLRGGRPAKPKEPSGFSGNPNNPDEPKKADNDNDIDNDSDIDNDKDIINTYAPTLLELINKFNELFDKHYRLTKERERKLRQRLKTFSMEQIMVALENMAKDKFYSGENDRGWMADPEFFLKNDEQIDRFLNHEKKKRLTSIKMVNGEVEEVYS
jgi:hypothetical protein